MSRGFVSTLFGIAMTIFSWYGPWEWPAWPALTVMERVFSFAYHELPYGQRAAVLVVLIVINVTFWAAAAALIATLIRRCTRDPSLRSG